MTRPAGPGTRDLGIRDVETIDPRVYHRVRQTLPPEPRTPSVGAILEAMCARLGKASKYDYEEPKQIGAEPPRGKGSHLVQGSARSLILQHPDWSNWKISAEYNINPKVVSNARVKLRKEGKLKETTDA